jgi:hypothetical protein
VLYAWLKMHNPHCFFFSIFIQGLAPYSSLKPLSLGSHCPMFALSLSLAPRLAPSHLQLSKSLSAQTCKQPSPQPASAQLLRSRSLDFYCALPHVLFGFTFPEAYVWRSQLCFLKLMLKFSVQTFYQPLFSIFPSTILFPSKSFPHQKAQRAKSKSPSSSFRGLLWQQTGGATGRGVTLQQEKPAFSSLEDTAVLPFPVWWLRAVPNSAYR